MSEPASASSVPVFNCIIDLAPPAADGTIVARVVNLAGIEGRGNSQREALAAAVAAFKAVVSKYHAADEPIPWLPEASPPADGASRRLIAVHL